MMQKKQESETLHFLQWRCFCLFLPRQSQKTSCSQRSSGLRPLFPASHDEPVPKGRVHGEDGACVSLGHQPDEEVVLPYIDVTIDGTRESEVVLSTEGHPPHQDTGRGSQEGPLPATCSSAKKQEPEKRVHSLDQPSVSGEGKRILQRAHGKEITQLCNSL